jgi:catechol 2,3-dioxygenase-like lactoylglutathione lyase family enzyme
MSVSDKLKQRETEMTLMRLDHVNIRTSNLAAMIEWYVDILGLVEGPRPPFDFAGAWLYIGDAPIVHLVGVKNEPRSIEPKIEHFAISATGLKVFLAKLKSREVVYSLDEVPDFPIVQVNIRDCDGNHIHIDFPHAETRDLH